MSKDPAFLLYSADFLVGTIGMSNEEVGMYMKLLCLQHQKGGVVCKAVFNSIVGNHAAVTDKFVECDDGYYNERLLDEMGKRAQKSKSLSANAKKRWNGTNSGHMTCKSNAIASPKHIPTEDEDEDVNKNVIGNRFEEIWAKYPNKDGKRIALGHFKKTVKSDKAWSDINTALTNYLASDKVARNFVKNGSTWFNNWEDWITDPVTNPAEEKELRERQKRIMKMYKTKEK